MIKLSGRSRSRDSHDQAAYKDVYSYGYLLTNGSSTLGAGDGWNLVKIGPFSCALEPKANYQVTTFKSCVVLFIGEVVDIARGENSLRRIGQRTAKECEIRGLDAAIKYVAYLGGRFTCYIYAKDALTVIPDCSASQSVYWYESDGVITISSHAHLVAQNRNLDIDPRTSALIEKRTRLQPKYTVHVPGLKTPFVNVRPVIANCVLSVPLQGGQPKHSRFYPFAELPERTFEEAFQRFLGVFLEHVRLLGRLGPIGVSLTAGVDSRSTFASANRLIKGGPRLSFTYINFEKAGSAEYEDLYMASKFSRRVGVPFAIARTDRPDPEHRFRVMFDQSFYAGAQAPNIAQALYEDIPHDVYEFASNVAEIGSAFYRNRDRDLWSPLGMASVYGHGPEIGHDRDFQETFDEYAEYCEFRPENAYSLDPYDLFYWEHRLTRWAANRYHEIDLGHRVLLPYNSRALAETMLSVPLEDRKNKRFQKSLIESYE